MLLGSLGVFGLALALGGNAGAATNPVSAVSGGTTTIRVNRPSVHRERVKPIPPATEPHEGFIILSNTGGAFDPVTAAGTVETSGGFKLKLRRGGTLLGPSVSDIVMTFGPDGKVSATVDEKTVDLATITGGKVTHFPDGSATIGGAHSWLTREGAKAFTKELPPAASDEYRRTPSSARSTRRPCSQPRRCSLRIFAYRPVQRRFA